MPILKTSPAVDAPPILCFPCFQAKRVGLEERAHTIGHTGRSSPISSANPPRRTSETMPLPQVSLPPRHTQVEHHILSLASRMLRPVFIP